MKLHISKKNYEAQWVDYKECKIHWLPYPMGKNSVVMSANQEIVITGNQRKKIFMESVLDIKGIVDDDGKPIIVTEAIKELIFERNLGGIAGFIYTKNLLHDSELNGELENLQSGQPGNMTPDQNPAQDVDSQ